MKHKPVKGPMFAWDLREKRTCPNCGGNRLVPDQKGEPLCVTCGAVTHHYGYEIRPTGVFICPTCGSDKYTYQPKLNEGFCNDCLELKNGFARAFNVHVY